MRTQNFLSIFLALLMISCSAPGPEKHENSKGAHYIVPCDYPGSLDQGLYQYWPDAKYSNKNYSLKSRSPNADVYECENFPTHLFETKGWSRSIRGTFDRGFQVFVSSPMCAAAPTAFFLTRSKSTYLFLTDANQLGQNVLDSLVSVLEQECHERPEKVNIKLVTRTAFRSYPPTDTKTIYEGHLALKGFDDPVLFDADPALRAAALKDEQRRVGRENTLRIADAARRKERNAAIAAVVVGYLQGIALEFGDEGICAALASLKEGSREAISIDQYNRCRNYLDNYLENLRNSHPGYYAISNFLGSLNANVDALLPEAKTREQEAIRGAVAGCMAGIASEYGKLRVGETPDDASLAASCKINASVGGVRGAVAGVK